MGIDFNILAQAYFRMSPSIDLPVLVILSNRCPGTPSTSVPCVLSVPLFSQSSTSVPSVLDSSLSANPGGLENLS